MRGTTQRGLPGISLMLVLSTASLRADDASARAVQAVERLGGTIIRDDRSDGNPGQQRTALPTSSRSRIFAAAEGARPVRTLSPRAADAALPHQEQRLHPYLPGADRA
jgi:hypothetical protein